MSLIFLESRLRTALNIWVSLGNSPNSFGGYDLASIELYKKIYLRELRRYHFISYLGSFFAPTTKAYKARKQLEKVTKEIIQEVHKKLNNSQDVSFFYRQTCKSALRNPFLEILTLGPLWQLLDTLAIRASTAFIKLTELAVAEHPFDGVTRRFAFYEHDFLDGIQKLKEDEEFDHENNNPVGELGKLIKQYGKPSHFLEGFLNPFQFADDLLLVVFHLVAAVIHIPSLLYTYIRYGTIWNEEHYKPSVFYKFIKVIIAIPFIAMAIPIKIGRMIVQKVWGFLGSLFNSSLFTFRWIGQKCINHRFPSKLYRQINKVAEQLKKNFKHEFLFQTISKEVSEGSIFSKQHLSLKKLAVDKIIQERIAALFKGKHPENNKTEIILFKETLEKLSSDLSQEKDPEKQIEIFAQVFKLDSKVLVKQERNYNAERFHLEQFNKYLNSFHDLFSLDKFVIIQNKATWVLSPVVASNLFQEFADKFFKSLESVGNSIESKAVGQKLTSLMKLNDINFDLNLILQNKQLSNTERFEKFKGLAAKYNLDFPCENIQYQEDLANRDNLPIMSLKPETCHLVIVNKLFNKFLEQKPEIKSREQQFEFINSLRKVSTLDKENRKGTALRDFFEIPEEKSEAKPEIKPIEDRTEILQCLQLTRLAQKFTQLTKGFSKGNFIMPIQGNKNSPILSTDAVNDIFHECWNKLAFPIKENTLPAESKRATSARTDHHHKGLYNRKYAFAAVDLKHSAELLRRAAPLEQLRQMNQELNDVLQEKDLPLRFEKFKKFCQTYDEKLGADIKTISYQKSVANRNKSVVVDSPQKKLDTLNALNARLTEIERHIRSSTNRTPTKVANITSPGAKTSPGKGRSSPIFFMTNKPSPPLAPTPVSNAVLAVSSSSCKIS